MNASLSFAPSQEGGSIFAGKPNTTRRRSLAAIIAGLALAIGFQSFVFAAPGGRSSGGSNGPTSQGSSSQGSSSFGKSFNSPGSQGSTPKTDTFRLSENKTFGDFKKVDTKPIIVDRKFDTKITDNKNTGIKITDIKKIDVKTVDSKNIDIKKIDIKPIAVGEKNPSKVLDISKGGKLDHVFNGEGAKKIDLSKQLKLADKGDIARQMNLSKKLLDMGGWKNHMVGKLSMDYKKQCFNNFYCGPFVNKCYQPKWCSWIDWCYFPTYDFWCDYRPLCCRPIYCTPCTPWVYCDYPVFYTLPTCDCGTWVDVAPVALDAGLDIQCLAVRFVDNGHAEKELGPRYRIWLRNNSRVDIRKGFDVLAMASMDDKMAEALPHAGSRVEAIKAGETISVDVRLPFAATSMGHDLAGAPMAFNKLHVVADARNELNDINRKNNGAVVVRTSILPVDPAVLNVDQKSAAPGSEISLAGEGLGPEGGKVLIDINGTETEGEIQGWTDIGARVKLPNVAVNGSADASIVMVRGDGAAASPVTIKLVAGGPTTSANTSSVKVAELPVTQLPE